MDRELSVAWEEGDSEDFLEWGRFFVPGREEQIETICRALPEPPPDALLVELCCGEGLLSGALLEHFPEARIRALDGSEMMLEAAREAHAAHGTRFEAERFDLAAAGWRQFDEAPWGIVSSLAIHHLDGAGKKALFADLAAALRPGGSLVIADLVRPASARGLELAARSWDEDVRKRSLELAGGEAAIEAFERLGWNLWLDPDGDPVDRPSTLLEQLGWLRDAGLEAVDVYWMKAGHAIFGGTKPSAEAGKP